MVPSQMPYVPGGNMHAPLASLTQIAGEGSKHVHILCVGDDRSLLASRLQVLLCAGFDAYSCTSGEGIRRFPFALDLVLICRSVPRGTAAQLCKSIRMLEPRARIIRLMPFNLDEGNCYDTMIDTAGGPAALVARLAAFLAESPQLQKDIEPA